MTLFILMDFCSMPWLAWLLPFILGLAMGWALWAKFKSLLEASQNENTKLQSTLDANSKQIATLEKDVHDSHETIADLRGDVAIAEGRMHEAYTELNSLKTSMEKSGTSSLVKAATATSPQTIEPIVKAQQTHDSDSKTASISEKKSSPFDNLEPNNLQIFEGIGPKMQEVLIEAGIKNWSDLGSKSESDLRAILDKHGDKYKIIDVSNWAGQAKLAASGNWADLIHAQEVMDGGHTDSKLKKMMQRLDHIKEYRKDDLKIIEGIGPKIAELLNAAGINTWQELAHATTENLRKILYDGGPKFQMADPTTWPKQSALALEGKFDELRAYQDILDGGKE